MKNLSLKSDYLWLGIFFLAAIFLYTYNLGEAPLRDWDEGIVATVAREIWRSTPDDYTWLYPQNLDGTPYWNKPPLIHNVIALSYSFFGISEWSTRFPIATISALAVPLLYALAREIFPRRLEAIYSTMVYLTLIPVVRHGRLAMLDGAITVFFSLAIWCLLRASKYNQQGVRRYVLGAGLAISLISLTKGLALGILLGAIAFVCYLLVAQVKHKFNFSFFVLIILGLLPAIAWYLLQIIHYGQDFIEVNLGIQTFNRIINTVENNSSPFWYYLDEIAKYSMPWLILLPGGIKLAWLQRQEPWAKLALVWFSFYLIAISVMATKLPWYVMPIYPAFALLVGANIAQIHHKLNLSLTAKILLIIVALTAWIGSIYYLWFAPNQDLDLFLILGSLALGLTIANILIQRRKSYFIPAIAIALYLALLLLFHSPHWNWELGESYEVKPVAEMIRQLTPPKQIIYTSYPYYRPSLDFYSEHRVIPLSNQQLPENQSFYLLLSRDNTNLFSAKDSKILATLKQWQLVKVKP